MIRHNTSDVIGFGKHNLNYTWTSTALYKAIKLHLIQISGLDIHGGLPSYKVESKEREACNLPKLYSFYHNYFKGLKGCHLAYGVNATIDDVKQGVSKITLLMTDDSGGQYVIKISKHVTTKIERDSKKYHNNIESQLWKELDTYGKYQGTKYEKFLCMPIHEYRNSGYYIGERAIKTCDGNYAIRHMSENDKNLFMDTVNELQLWDVLHNDGNVGIMEDGSFKIIDFAL